MEREDKKNGHQLQWVPFKYEKIRPCLISTPKRAKLVFCPKSFHPILHNSLSLNHQSHSSKTRLYYTNVIKILNRNSYHGSLAIIICQI